MTPYMKMFLCVVVGWLLVMSFWYIPWWIPAEFLLLSALAIVRARAARESRNG